jgi:hypothetical protein
VSLTTLNALHLTLSLNHNLYVTLVDFYYHVPFGFLIPNKFQISWLSNILALSVPEEGYRRHAC